MKSFYYCVEVNLTHPASPTTQGVLEDLRAITYISRSFMNVEAVGRSIEKDITSRMSKFCKNGNLPVRVVETNPFRLTEYDQLQETAKEDEQFAKYLTSWDDTLVNRLTIIDEGLENEDDEMAETSFADMPPKDYILRYYVREYEDGLAIPTGLEGNLMLMPGSIH
jgi:hypothetical protein